MFNYPTPRHVGRKEIQNSIPGGSSYPSLNFSFLLFNMNVYIIEELNYSFFTFFLKFS